MADVIVLKTHVRTENESDDAVYGFYGEVERIFNKFAKYHIKIELRDLNANVKNKGMFTLANLNKSSHEGVGDGR